MAKAVPATTIDGATRRRMLLPFDRSYRATSITHSILLQPAAIRARVTAAWVYLWRSRIFLSLA